MRVAPGFPHTEAQIAWLQERAAAGVGAGGGSVEGSAGGGSAGGGTGGGSVVEGVQLTVLRGDRTVVDEVVGVDGRRRPLTGSTLGQVRCCVAKPLLALTIASLVADGRCDWDTPIGDLVDGPFHPEVAACTIDDLLCHRAGLHGIPAMLLNLTTPATRLDLARTTPPVPGWRRSVDSAYCESSAALLTGAAIETLTGRPYEDVVEERVLGPAALEASNLVFRMSNEFYDAHRHRIGVSSATFGTAEVPLLVEESREMATEWNPSWSAFATARGIAQLFRYILDLGDGHEENSFLPRSVVDHLLTPRAVEPGGRHQTDQLVLGRGLHHRLRLIGVPERFASGTFGHFGYGVALGFADRELGVAIGLRFTNQVEDSVQLMRIERLVSAVYADITGEDLPGDAPFET